jgi:hypothetical protein
MNDPGMDCISCASWSLFIRNPNVQGQAPGEPFPNEGRSKHEANTNKKPFIAIVDESMVAIMHWLRLL